jgi:hypothetical protein
MEEEHPSQKQQFFFEGILKQQIDRKRGSKIRYIVQKRMRVAHGELALILRETNCQCMQTS